MYQGVILASILTTWLCAWYDGSAPYFPIEISRTATGRLSYYPLLAGSVAAFFVLPKEQSYVSWFGFFLLAAVDDVTHWGIHMAGVIIMMVGVLIRVWGDARKLTALVAIGGLFAARIVAKLLVVWGVELDMTWDFANVLATSKKIMFTGECRHPSLTLPVFKIGGIMQWLCFWAISYL